MQLKRETDYALRLLLCVAKQTESSEAGVTVQALSKRTAVPLTIANRLCKKLEEEELLKSTDISENIVSYVLCESTLNKTVYDVIRAIEGCCDLFAVFDKMTELYSSGKEYFEDAERQFTEILKSITICDLKEKKTIC